MRLISKSANILGSAHSPPAHSHLLDLLSFDGSFLPFSAVSVSSHCCMFWSVSLPTDSFNFALFHTSDSPSLASGEVFLSLWLVSGFHRTRTLCCGLPVPRFSVTFWGCSSPPGEKSVSAFLSGSLRWRNSFKSLKFLSLVSCEIELCPLTVNWIIVLKNFHWESVIMSIWVQTTHPDSGPLVWRACFIQSTCERMFGEAHSAPSTGMTVHIYPMHLTLAMLMGMLEEITHRINLDRIRKASGTLSHYYSLWV